MNITQKKNTPFPIVPGNEKKCVWMELGIVSYKICDRNFECDSCPLDQGLRGTDDAAMMNHPKQPIRQPGDSAIAQKFSSRKHPSTLQRVIKLKLDENCYVHPGHTWMKILNQNQVKIGIDDIAATTLGSIDEIILPLPGEKITRGASCGQIIQYEHIFSIVSPLSGRVMAVNKNLSSFPNKLILDPLNKGWAIVIKPENLEQDLTYCRSGDALYSWYLKEFKWFECNLAKSFQSECNTAGITLNDGGEISRNLRNHLPKENYRRLIVSLLGTPEAGR